MMKNKKLMACLLAGALLVPSMAQAESAFFPDPMGTKPMGTESQEESIKIFPEKTEEEVVKEVIKEVVLTIGSDKYTLDGEEKALDAVPVVKEDRTFLPLRAVAESMGCTVEFTEAKTEVKEEAKKDEVKEEAKKDEVKDEAKKDEVKDEAKKDEVKEEPKKEEVKEQPKKEEETTPATITVKKGDVTIVMHPGETKYTVNGVEKTLDVAPYIEGDRTMVPVRFVAEALNLKVEAVYNKDGLTEKVVIKG